jgi:hypothetical protein
MLHYKDRNNSIHIITIDRVLLEDVYERLHEYPGMESIELVKPGNEHSAITPEDILQSARDTLKSRVLIIDVRNQTKPMLQRAYSDIVRFNRPDFNRYCYSVLIGDGPINLYNHSKGIDVFQNYLSDLRIDYSPAVFFGSPFFHYSNEEAEEGALYPERIPKRFEKYFKGEKVSAEQVSRYFIAADVQENLRPQKKKERQKLLANLYAKIIADEFPKDKESLIKILSKEGCDLPGESLKLHAYPFFFEELTLDLIRKAEQAI